jgi:5'-nucleotidase
VRILLTNDDGVNAQGLAAAADALADLGEVTIVAPDMERSGVAHSISLAQPLRIRRVYHGEAFFGYAVSGSPVDCVKLACSEVLDAPPDLLVSGINLGPNAAINVLYSGTVAAAIEGAMLGIPSVAFSLDETERPDFDQAARVAREVLQRVLDDGFPAHTLLNVNIPGLPRSQIKGIRVTHQSRTRYEDAYDRRYDPWGRTYYWIAAEGHARGHSGADSDLGALERGYVSVTPLHFDLTNHETLAELAALLNREWAT